MLNQNVKPSLEDVKKSAEVLSKQVERVERMNNLFEQGHTDAGNMTDEISELIKMSIEFDKLVTNYAVSRTTELLRAKHDKVIRELGF